MLMKQPESGEMLSLQTVHENAQHPKDVAETAHHRIMPQLNVHFDEIYRRFVRNVAR